MVIKNLKMIFVLLLAALSSSLAADKAILNIVTFDYGEGAPECYISFYELPHYNGESFTLVGAKEIPILDISNLPELGEQLPRSIYIGEKALITLFKAEDFTGKSSKFNHKANKFLKDIKPRYDISQYKSMIVNCSEEKNLSAQAEEFKNKHNGEYVETFGKITKLYHSSFLLDTGVRILRVSTRNLEFNPFDNNGEVKLEVDDWIRVTGKINDNFLKNGSITASSIMELNTTEQGKKNERTSE